MPRRRSRGKDADHLPRRRINIQDEDGWTHVTSCNRRNINIGNTSNSRRDKSQKATADSLRDELVPAEIPEGLTLKKLVEQYESHRQKWQESHTWKTLRTSIEENEHFVARSEGTASSIANYVCIALGSPSGFLRGGLVDRRSVSLFQLAAFTSIVDVLSGPDSSVKVGRCYAQDPVFNTLDTELLESLDIKVIKDSSAFGLVSEKTFLFAPGTERQHLLELLPLNPVVFFGGPLDSSHSIAAPEEESSILAEFTQKMKSVRLPEFEPNTAPFWGTSLFWRASWQAD